MMRPRSLRPNQRREVLVCGCFDLFHAGHLALLLEAARYGRVTVGLNSDASVQGLKGPGRPFVPYDERAALLRNLRPVAEVWLLDRATPEAMIRFLQPDVYVKGSEYEGCLPEQALVEELGGRVVWVTRSAVSTTGRAQAIRNS